MKPSNVRGRPSPFRKSEEERGEKSKLGMSPRLENGSPPRSDSVTESQMSKKHWTTGTFVNAGV